jgi:transcriptional antiterminator NusG
MAWNVINVTPGFEQRIKNSIETSQELKSVDKRIFIPTVQKKGFVNGKVHYYLEKLFPGYVLVECEKEHYDHVFSYLSGLAYVLNMSSMKGVNRVAYPIDDQEILDIVVKMGGEHAQPPRESEHDFNVNDRVKIKSGPFSNFECIIKEINRNKTTETKIKVATRLFNSDLTFLIVSELQIEPIQGE